MPQTAAPTTPPHAVGHAFKGLGDWIEIFRAGTHTDSKGVTCSFTEADLDQMVANVATCGAPPAVLGHPKHNDPAYAWAHEVKREGASLFAKFDDINPDFESGVASGAYRNRSVSILKDAQHGWRLQHIGWLGAAPPAIAGLKPVEFSADDQAEQHQFGMDDMTTGFAIGDIAQVLRGLRDWVISKDGLDVADRVLPTWSLDSIANAAVTIREQTTAEAAAEGDSLVAGLAPMPYSQPTGAAMSFTQADLDRTAAETEARIRAELAAAATAQQAQFTAAQTALQQLQRERQTERIGAQIASWKAEGRLLPAEEPGLAEFMAALEGTEAASFEFTAAGGSKQTQSRADWFAAFMAARKPLIKLGAPRAADDEPAALDQNDVQAIATAAREFQASEATAGRTVSIDQAVTRVMARSAA